MTLRDDLARVVAERRAANPRNEPGHMDYGIADAVLGVVRQALLAIDVEDPTDDIIVGKGADKFLAAALALFPEEHQQ